MAAEEELLLLEEESVQLEDTVNDLHRKLKKATDAERQQLQEQLEELEEELKDVKEKISTQFYKELSKINPEEE